MYFVYLLLCDDETLYTGITTDLARRLREHRQGTGGAYTRTHGAQHMVCIATGLTRSSAQQQEMQIKKLTRIQKQELYQETIDRQGQQDTL